MMRKFFCKSPTVASTREISSLKCMARMCMAGSAFWERGAGGGVTQGFRSCDEDAWSEVIQRRGDPRKFLALVAVNDLINQRFVGEIHLDEFSVSHTKDDIQWENDEEEKVEAKLKEECSDFTAFIRASGRKER